MRNEFLRGQPAPEAPAKKRYEHREYPKALHHPDLASRVVGTPEAAAALLADGWYESPADFPEGGNVEAPENPEVAALREEFNAVWKELLEKHDDLKAANHVLVAENARLTEALESATETQPEEAPMPEGAPPTENKPKRGRPPKSA